MYIYYVCILYYITSNKKIDDNRNTFDVARTPQLPPTGEAHTKLVMFTYTLPYIHPVVQLTEESERLKKQMATVQ